jgi:hypothetical protein
MRLVLEAELGDEDAGAAAVAVAAHGPGHNACQSTLCRRLVPAGVARHHEHT